MIVRKISVSAERIQSCPCLEPCLLSRFTTNTKSNLQKDVPFVYSDTNVILGVMCVERKDGLYLSAVKLC